MDRLPCELLYHIRRYIDQPTDLLHMAYVCRRWQSFIMEDEYFLNQYFSRSLKRSQKSYYYGFSHYNNVYKLPLPFNINRSLFPVNFQLSDCHFLPWTDSRRSCDYKTLIELGYHLSLFESSHSFYFWLFSPHPSELNIQLGSLNANGVIIMLCADQNYYFDKKNRLSIADRWTHIVLTKIDSHRYYRVWIDGQYVSKPSQYYLYRYEIHKKHFLINLVLFRKFDSNTLEASRMPRIADLNAFTRCLTPIEIRAIHQQQTLIDQVKVGTFIKSNKKHNIKMD
ncbi:unnamed protein product [Rotaria sp. Silwood1]|nr:unnamed protein product [Rotaria sp. Silwood1]